MNDKEQQRRAAAPPHTATGPVSGSRQERMAAANTNLLKPAPPEQLELAGRGDRSLHVLPAGIRLRDDEDQPVVQPSRQLLEPRPGRDEALGLGVRHPIGADRTDLSRTRRQW